MNRLHIVSSCELPATEPHFPDANFLNRTYAEYLNLLCICSELAGGPAGPEGPMVHLRDRSGVIPIDADGWPRQPRGISLNVTETETDHHVRDHRHRPGRASGADHHRRSCAHPVFTLAAGGSPRRAGLDQVPPAQQPVTDRLAAGAPG